MANAKRDVNKITVGLGVTDDASLTPTQLVVDPITNRLSIIIAEIYTSSPTTSATAKHDANSETTAMGVTDDGNTTLENLRTHNGFTLVEFV